MAEVAHFVRVLQMNTDGPDVLLGLSDCLLANELPFVPASPMRMVSVFRDRILAVDRSLILEPMACDGYREDADSVLSTSCRHLKH